ncbi:MAG: hypothetical protein RBQ97_11040 [Acholeplasma sp.]|nr:hypothetical protein [Acholeplasma sp.]
MDFSDYLSNIDLNISNEYKILSSFLNGSNNLEFFKRVIDDNWHNYPFSEGSYDYRELFNRINTLSIDLHKAYLLLAQMFLELINFTTSDLIDNVYFRDIYMVREGTEIQKVVRKIDYCLDRLGYAKDKKQFNKYKKVILIEKNPLASSLITEIQNDEISTKIMEFNYVDTNYDQKRLIVLLFYKYFDSDNIKKEVRNSTNGIKRTFNNLMQILENIKHSEDHPVSLQFINRNINVWIDNAYNLSLEVFKHMSNKKINIDFEENSKKERS